MHFIPQYGKSCWCYVLSAEPAHTNHGRKCRSSGAGGSDPQVFTWRYPVSAFIKNRPGWDFWMWLQPPPFAGLIFYQSKEQDCFCSSSVLLPLSLPSATAGIRKGRGCWGWWDRACLKACAQLGQCYGSIFSLCLVLVIPFILSCSYRAKSGSIIYSKLLNI